MKQAPQQQAPLILVVEDDQDIRDLIADVLLEEGYRVERASDGLTALEHLRTHKPNLILLDLMLPRISGETVSMMLHYQPEEAPPVVVVTAQPDLAKGTLQMGVREVLAKPFDVQTLIETVQRYVALPK